MKADLISTLTETEVDHMMDLLEPLDSQIKKRVDFAIKKFKTPKAHALEYIVTENPILWAKVYLNWEARDYQLPILLEAKKSRQLVLRLGRRLGKTDSMCIMILWYAYTQYNRGNNDQYDIVIATPYENQVDLIFDRLKQLVNGSKLMSSLRTKDVHHRMCFNINGIETKVLGFTAGANNSSGGGNSMRGQRADVLILDECDYIGSKQITNILNIRNEAPERIKLICASTPSGKHEEYYRWCQDASKHYLVTEDDKKNNEFNGYIIKEDPKGNGWTEIYAPSNVNKELLKINPDTNQTYLEDIKDELSEMRYVQEVMAEFGEEELGVYQKQYIQAAINEGKRLEYRYITKWNKEDRKEYLRKTKGINVRLLGIDWDKYANATNMVCMEFDKLHKDENGMVIPVFKVLFRIEIPRSEFTYVNAMNKVIELNKEYDFDWIAIDRGYGETQLEMFHQYGHENPSSGFADKVVGFQFSEKIEVTDPHTRKRDKKHLKPFMVNNSVNLFEKCKVILDPDDKYIIEELEEYRIKSISSSGLPIYTDENEHAIDAMNLALLIFAQKYDKLLRKVYSSKIALINSVLDARTGNEESRISEKEENDLSFIRVVNLENRIHAAVSVTGKRGRQKNRYPSEFTRSLW